MKKRFLMGVLLALPMPAVLAEAETQPRAPGAESAGYVWNEMTGEKAEALRATGDPARGRAAFTGCRGCHRNDGAGRQDGSYPRLAGQHATVLIKQIADIRSGKRDNWKMYPFANEHVLTPQDMADIAVYLQGLPVTPDQGTGPGKDLARGRALYERDCTNCHGAQGLGDAREFYPRLAGQHYQYLLHEARAIRDGERRNANPRMIKAVKGYSDADLEAVNDYVSRLGTR